MVGVTECPSALVPLLAAVPGADMVCLSLPPGTVLACTDDRCADIGSAHDGPGAHAARLRRVVVADVVEIRTLWPEFARAAREARIFGFLAAPLFRGARHVGTLSWYAQRSGALTEAAVPAAERACRALPRLPISPDG